MGDVIPTLRSALITSGRSTLDENPLLLLLLLLLLLHHCTWTAAAKLLVAEGAQLVVARPTPRNATAHARLVDHIKTSYYSDFQSEDMILFILTGDEDNTSAIISLYYQVVTIEDGVPAS